jgi:uncharacterized protein (DUF3820 family)
MNGKTELTDDCLMPWGKYKDTPMIDVPADYLLYMYKSKKCCNLVKAYIEDNKDVLIKELKEQNPEIEEDEY